jgi:hypothetical protein
MVRKVRRISDLLLLLGEEAKANCAKEERRKGGKGE